jgi:adenosine deaminase
MGRPRHTAFIVALLAASGLAPIASAPASSEQAASEQRAAQELDAIRGDPLALRVFLKRMPKGADLHNHLDGAVYAETFIRVGGEDGLCVDPVAKSFTKSQPIKSGAEPAPVCEAGDIPAAEVPKNQRLYDELVDSFSMRGFVASEGETEHDHFFGHSPNSAVPTLATRASFSTRSPHAPPRRTNNISS